MAESDTFKEAASKLSWGRFNKRIVNDLKVADHHGLLVTERIPSQLPGKENAIYELIAYRLLESLSSACLKETTDVGIEVLDCDFSTTGSKIIEPGWREIRNSFSDEDSEVLQDLPMLTNGDELKIKEAIVLEKKTSAPSLYTEASLLSAMENAGREIEKEEERKILYQIGIGTPATRAAIIETLFGRDYIKRNKKTLVPTEKGMQVYELVKNKKIADAVMTAEWELTFQRIERGEITSGAFQKEMENYAAEITQELLHVSIPRQNLPELPCPKCGKNQLLIRDKIVKCPDDKCGWLQYRMVCGVQLSISDINSLINKRKTPLLKGMKSRSGNKFNAYIKLSDNGDTSFEFESQKPKK